MYKNLAKKTITVAAASIIGLSAITPVFAQEDPESAPVNNTYYSGANVVVEDDVEGDLYVSGGDIVVNGEVDENLYFFGNSLRTEGRVKQSAFLFGRKASMGGEVKDNLFGVVRDFQTQFETGEIGEDLNLVSSRVLLRADVDDDVNIVAREVYIDTDVRIKGDVHIKASVVRIHPEAELKGDVIMINGSSNIEEFHSEDIPTDLTLLPVLPSLVFYIFPLLSVWAVFFVFAMIIGNAIAMYALVKFFPVRSERALKNMRFTKADSKENLKLGIVSFLAMIVAVVVLAISIIGWPLLALMGVLALLVIILARYFFVYKVGKVIVKKIQPKVSNSFINALVGELVVLTLALILLAIPYIGGPIANVIGFLFFLWAIGAVIRVKFGDYQKATKK